MCYHCWAHMGFPDESSAEILKCAELVVKLDDEPFNSRFHGVIDDWNLTDRDIEGWWSDIGRDIEDDFEVRSAALETEIVRLMIMMTEKQRASVLARAQGMIPTPSEAA